MQNELAVAINNVAEAIRALAAVAEKGLGPTLPMPVGADSTERGKEHVESSPARSITFEVESENLGEIGDDESAPSKKIGVLAREKEGRSAVCVYIVKHEIEATEGKKATVEWLAEIRHGERVIKSEKAAMRRKAKMFAKSWLDSASARDWAVQLRDGGAPEDGNTTPKAVPESSVASSERKEAEPEKLAENSVEKPTSKGVEAAPPDSEEEDTLRFSFSAKMEGREALRLNRRTGSWGMVDKLSELACGEIVYLRDAETGKACFWGKGKERTSVVGVKSVRFSNEDGYVLMIEPQPDWRRLVVETAP